MTRLVMAKFNAVKVFYLTSTLRMKSGLTALLSSNFLNGLSET